jgi:hypothetical protein
MEAKMATQARASEGTGTVEKDETSRLIASSKVEGTEVYSRNGEHLGEVYNFMVDKFTGQVAYAVMSFGGFLGIGERYHPLPWKALDYDPQPRRLCRRSRPRETGERAKLPTR